MTRGRRPKKAAAEALPCARCRGGVLEIPDTSRLPFDLMIISPVCIAFVKVMRMRARVMDPPDALVYQSSSVIRKLWIVPESAVAVMELLCTFVSCNVTILPGHAGQDRGDTERWINDRRYTY